MKDVGRGVLPYQMPKSSVSPSTVEQNQGSPLHMPMALSTIPMLPSLRPPMTFPPGFTTPDHYKVADRPVNKR